MSAQVQGPKERLNAAFKAMRKAGLVARQSFSCCQGCAGAQIAKELREMSEVKRAAVKGAVFYTKQDAANLFGSRGEFAGTYLAFGNVGVTLEGGERIEVGEGTLKVAEMACEALRAAGLKVEWDGTDSARIWVEEVQS